MRTTDDLVKDVIDIIGDEDERIKASCFAMMWAVDAIQVDEADSEGEPCSRAKAIKLLRHRLEIEAGIALSQKTVSYRLRTAIWLRQQNRVFINGIEFGKHRRAMVAGATWKELKENPSKFTKKEAGKDGGVDIRKADLIDIPQKLKAAVTIIERMVEVCEREGRQNDEEGNFTQSALFHSAAASFGAALPHLRAGKLGFKEALNT